MKNQRDSSGGLNPGHYNLESFFTGSVRMKALSISESTEEVTEKNISIKTEHAVIQKGRNIISSMDIHSITNTIVPAYGLVEMGAPVEEDLELEVQSCYDMEQAMDLDNTTPPPPSERTPPPPERTPPPPERTPSPPSCNPAEMDLRVPEAPKKKKPLPAIPVFSSIPPVVIAIKAPTLNSADENDKDIIRPPLSPRNGRWDGEDRPSKSPKSSPRDRGVASSPKTPSPRLHKKSSPSTSPRAPSPRASMKENSSTSPREPSPRLSIKENSPRSPPTTSKVDTISPSQTLYANFPKKIISPAKLRNKVNSK
jgi:hypothetical protein